jgi:hypothetical protein
MMSTMVVRMDCRPEFKDEVLRHLRQDVVVWAHEQEGFVVGSWHITEDGRFGLGLVEFDTLEAAERAASAPRSYHDPSVPFRISSVEVFEQIAAATPARP